MASGEYGEGGEPPNYGNPAKKSRIDQMTEERVPRFLVVKKADGRDFASTNPFRISKAMYGYIGEVEKIQKIKDGLLIETKTQKQARKLLEMKKFLELDITVVPHGSLNVTKGVITCSDLLNCTEEELRNELKSQGVTEVRRITTRKNGSIQPTASIILTFNREKLPNKILAAMYALPVRVYIPNPMRCFRCQKFGHTSKYCNKTPICACGLPPHDGEPCSTPINCVNCNGNHSARSKDCPKFKEELEIVKYKTTNKCSFKEAKEYVTNNSPRFSVSFAEVAAKNPTAAPPSISDLASTLLPQIKKLVEETLTINLTSIIQQITNAINQPKHIPQPKPAPNIQPTSGRIPPDNQNTATTSNVPTTRIPAVQPQQMPLKHYTRSSTYMKPPTAPQSGSSVINRDAESSDMSVDGTAVEEARKPKDRRTGARSKQRKYGLSEQSN